MAKAAGGAAVETAKNGGRLFVYALVAIFLVVPLMPTIFGAASDAVTTAAVESAKTPLGAAAAVGGAGYAGKKLADKVKSNNGGGGGGGGAAAGGGAGGAAAAAKKKAAPAEIPAPVTTTTQAPTPTTQPPPPTPAKPRISREPLTELRPPTRGPLRPELPGPQPQGGIVINPVPAPAVPRLLPR